MRLAVLLAAALAAAAPAAAQLPTAERVLADYHAALGGRDRVAAVRDATVEWRTGAGGRPLGTAVSRRMAPGSLSEQLGSGAANVSTPSLTWRRRPDGTVRADTTPAGERARLQAALEAGFLLDLPAQDIAARVLAADSADGEPAWRVEFSRGGARSVYLFGARTHLPRRIVVNEAAGLFIRYSDYRPVDGVLEPHRVEITNGQPGNGIVFTLASARHNTGLTERDFAMPTP